MRVFRFFGYVLDRLDVGGWLLLLSGVAIVAATVLVPTWRSVLEMQAQVDQLQVRCDLLHRQLENYNAFKREYEAGNPLLMQRLAWQQLRLKPPGAEMLDSVQLSAELKPEPVNVEQWVQPMDVIETPYVHGNDPLRDAPFIHSRLAALITGPHRPYVLALGGFLILLSLVLNPTPCVDRDDDTELDADEFDDDELDESDE
ncbi:MAG: hypothetical protein GC159_20170 [Phycisphaera sp.]|nr:hypothetical protein [Phycisphaera sp.]